MIDPPPRPVETSATGQRAGGAPSSARDRPAGAKPQAAARYDATMSQEPRTLRLTAVVTKEGDWYVAQCLEVDVASQGETIELALANLREALELYFEDQPVPSIVEPIVAPVEVQVPA